MKRITLLLLAAVMVLTLAACDAFGVSFVMPTEAATEAPEATPGPTPDDAVPADNPGDATPAPEAPPTQAPSGEITDSIGAAVTIGGERQDITLKRQESSMGYVMYVWEERFAYKAQDNKEVYTLDWQGMKLPDVSISVELVKGATAEGIIEATATQIGEGGEHVELLGAVSKPAYFLAGTLLRITRYGDYETTTDAYLIENGGDVFRIIVTYFPEALEDVGQAIMPMLDSFVIKQ